MTKNEPVLMLAVVAVLTEAGGLLVAGGTFLTGVGGVLARSLVTPMAKETKR